MQRLLKRLDFLKGLIKMTENEYTELAALLFPDITETPEQCEQRFPKDSLRRVRG